MEYGAGAGAAGGAAMAGDIPPSQTLYINNINEKIKKAPLKKALYTAFSQYGRIVDVVACKTDKLRGQAWIVFADVPSAGNAIKALQGFPLYDKQMRIQFAKTKSHAIEKLEGNYRARPKRSREKGMDLEDKAAAGAGAGAGAGGAADKGHEAKRARPAAAEAEGAGAGASAGAGAAAAGGSAAPAAPPAPAALPSSKLLVQNLPSLNEDMLGAMLRELFGRYPGLTEVRVVAPRRLAFVEYANEASAVPALQGLHNFLYDGTNGLQVTYAR